jgi:hypothetical protein
MSAPAGALTFGRRRVAGWPISGIAETQEMFHFCAELGVTRNRALCNGLHNDSPDRVLAGDVRWRFVIEAVTLVRRRDGRRDRRPRRSGARWAVRKFALPAPGGR